MAHRALAAVDCAHRARTPGSRCGRCCARHARTSSGSSCAFETVFGPRQPPRADMTTTPGGARAIERAALPRVAIRPRAGGRAARTESLPRSSRRLERGRAAAAQGLRQLQRARDGARPRADRAARPAAGRRRLSRRRRRHAAGATSRICGGWCAPRCAPRASPSSATGARPASGLAGRAGVRRVRLDGAVRADAAPVPSRLRRRPPAGRGVRVRDAPDADHQRARRT